MRLICPELEKRRPFQDELVGLGRSRQSIKQTFQAVPRQQVLEVFPPLTSEVHQPLAD
jgi:hypothetical protein